MEEIICCFCDKKKSECDLNYRCAGHAYRALKRRLEKLETYIFNDFTDQNPQPHRAIYLEQRLQAKFKEIETLKEEMQVIKLDREALKVECNRLKSELYFIDLQRKQALNVARNCS